MYPSTKLQSIRRKIGYGTKFTQKNMSDKSFGKKIVMSK